LAKKTLVLGASLKEERYSHKAVKRLTKHGHEVIALGRTPGKIGEIAIQTKQEDFKDIDTVTVYLSEKNQDGLFEYFKRIEPKRVIFNPGAENSILCNQLNKRGIECLNACTLVMLSVDNY